MAAPPIPEVFVLWHPDCVLGERLARRIFEWLRPGNGLGPQVFYRSRKAPGAPLGGLPLPLPGESRISAGVGLPPRVPKVQIILPLIDAHMVVDPAWREWLVRLGPPSRTRVFRPVALDATAFNVPPPLCEQNFLRPSGLPLPVDKEAAEPAFEAVARSLLKQLTEALCRHMLSGQGEANGAALAGDALPKLKIFLSHAKADGAAPARRLRDYIYSQTQLAAFFDENDIAFGAGFARVLAEALDANETAALIVIRSAKYASRPWCRRELSLFRQPHDLSGAAKEGKRWRLYPTLIVDALESGKQTASIPELGNSTCLRWGETVPDQEEQIVTTILRDVMLSAFHSALGATIGLKKDQIIINWLPDPTTLLQIPRVQGGLEDLDVIHPGRSLSGLELDTLFEFFPRLTFRSFEEVQS